MASRANRTGERRPAARLYLVIPQVIEPADVATALSEGLAAADVAAVLLRLGGADDSTLVRRAQALALLVQKRGAALLLDGHQDIVVRSGADGAHLAGIDQFRAAFAALKPDRIAGCGGLKTRHDAMLAGEADAAQRRPSFAAVLDRIAWWAELFEVPCVGYAANAEEVAPLAAAGADFVALGEWVFAQSAGQGGPAATIVGAARCLADVEVAA